MNLKEYLRTRHPTVNALTKAEAKLIGLDYPLVGGWVKKYGNLELPDEIVTKLKQAKRDRDVKVFSNKAKKQYAPKMTKKEKREQVSEISKLVSKIINNGCSDKARMIAHLNKPAN